MKHINIIPYLFFAVSLLFNACQKTNPKADLIIFNANIWTGEDAQETGLEAMAIAGDSILAIGTNEAMNVFKSEATKMVDIEGRFVTPGFIDAHVHLMMGGRSLLNVELRDADTPEELSKRIGDFAQQLQVGKWILEGNWDHTLWGGELPKKEWIDPYTKNNPVAVYRLDGHMLLVNSAALKFAGIDKNTPNVEGGEIIRYKNGELTGVLKDNAMNLILDKIPPMTLTEQDSVFRAAMDYFLENGVTSVHDVDGLNKDFESFSSANRLRESGELKVRVYAATPLNEWETIVDTDKKSDKWLKVGVLKGFADGSLGSHTAAFFAPYTDKASDKGFFINSKKNLYKWVSQADKAGLHIVVHAIGDHAINAVLDIYDRIIKENGQKDRRLRIEHAQHIAPEDIKRFAELGVIASMQPYHAIDDGRWAEEAIGGERIKTTYAFKSLLDADAMLVFGSDWAVAPASPLQGIYAALTRQTLDGKNQNGWVPEQKIDVYQALKAYTKDAAYASFEEDIKGTLEVGKLADFVVMSEDIRTTEPVKIKDIEVLQTYVGGVLVFEKE